MGLVARQTIKNNLLSFIGVVIGAFTQIWVYPEDLEIKGFLDLIIKYAQLLVPFIMLGMNGIMLRFLPFSQNDRKQAAFQFFTRAILLITLASTVLLTASFFLDNLILTWLQVNANSIPKAYTYRFEFILMATILAYSAIVTTHLVNFHRVALSVVFNNLFLKVGLPLAVLGYVWGWFDRYDALLTVIMTLTLALIGLLGYAAYLGILHFRLGSLNLRSVKPKDMYSYGAISLLGIAGSALIVQLDVVMVGGFIGNEAAGIYTFAAFAAMVISIPYKAINSITSPLIATALANNDFITIEKLYQDASKVLFAIGGVIFTGMVVCLPYVYEFTENTGEYAVAYSATLLLGASQLFDQVTSINATIFGQSSYYKWYISLLILMGMVNVALNYYFIGTLDMGYTGAAIATTLSLGLLNVCKALFVKVKLKVQPFSWSIVQTAAALFCIGFVSYILPDFFSSPFLNFGTKGGVIVGLFYLYIRYTNGIPIMKKVLQGGIKKLFT